MWSVASSVQAYMRVSIISARFAVPPTIAKYKYINFGFNCYYYFDSVIILK